MKRGFIFTIIITLIIMVVATMLMGTGVKAASSSFSASVTASQKTLNPGDTVTITLGISDINMGSDGINTVEGTLSYDSAIFETVSSSNIQSLNNWSTTYNEGTGKFLSVMLGDGVKSNTQIFSITLTVKASATETTATVSLKDITSNNGTDLVSAGTKSAKVTIASAETSTETNTTTDTTSTEASKTTSGSSSSKTTKKTVNDTTIKSGSSLPKTGLSLQWTILGISITGIILISGLILYGVNASKFKDTK